MIKIEKQKGFTLIEMLISITVFVIFLTVLMGSYNQILKSQQKADGYRVLYSESRRIVEEIRNEILTNQIKYVDFLDGINTKYNTSMHELELVDASGSDIIFKMQDCNDNICDLRLKKYINDKFSDKKINTHIKIKNFDVFVSPAANPYLEKNVFIDTLQFQPKITIFIRFVLDADDYNESVEFAVQTTVSSRFYMP